jgi:hypothetical protein
MAFLSKRREKKRIKIFVISSSIMKHKYAEAAVVEKKKFGVNVI